MTVFIGHSVALIEIARVTKSTAAAVQREAAETDLFVGTDWAGRAALSVVDAHALASGTARRDRDHDVAWRAHLAASEAWETARERLRAGAFHEAHDVALREGRGAPAAASAGHEAAREAVGDFERRTPPPEFNGASTSARWFTKAADKVKELI